MLYFKVENGNVTATTYEHVRDPEWKSRHDFKTFFQAEFIASGATELTGIKHIAIDNSQYVSPRFDVIPAPAIGDAVSYSFNGDTRPDGHIVSVSTTMKVVTTSTGNKYYRKKLSGVWKRNGTWTMIRGHKDERNPHF